MNDRVRSYQASDFDSLIELYKDKSSYGGKYDPQRDTPERLLRTAEQGNLYVDEGEGGQLLGSVMILDNPHSFWLLRFVVKDNDPKVARLLADYAQDLARQRGHESIIVYTDPSDEALNQRYIELGYTSSTNYKCYWVDVDGEEGHE